MIGSQGYLTVWEVSWLQHDVSKRLFKSQFYPYGWISEPRNEKVFSGTLDKLACFFKLLFNMRLSSFPELFSWTWFVPSKCDWQNDWFARLHDGLSSSLSATGHYQEALLKQIFSIWVNFQTRHWKRIIMMICIKTEELKNLQTPSTSC